MFNNQLFKRARTLKVNYFKRCSNCANEKGVLTTSKFPLSDVLL